MKFTPYLSLVFGKFYRELTRTEAAEILRQARKSAGGCFQLAKGMICIGPLTLFTRHV